MRVHYGILAGLAMAVLAGGVQAEPRPAFASKILQATLMPVAHADDTPAKGTLLAKVRTASVTKVAETAQPGLSGTVKRVENYFNGLDTLQAEFVQTVTGEKDASRGTFYWTKPGKFLWLYHQPVEQKIVSTGSAIYFVDDRQQATQLPTDAGVARLFNAKTFNFSKQGLRATHVREMGRELFVTFAVEKPMAARDNAGLKELTLAFTKLPRGKLQLARIEALDTLGVTTRVELRDMKENVRLVRSLFVYTPGVYRQRN